MGYENTTLKRGFRFRHPAVLLVVLAIVALLAGVLIYLLDRSPSKVYFLMGWMTEGEHPGTIEPSKGYFGYLGYYLPTLLHTFAFILLTMAMVIPYQNYKQYILRVSLFWFVFESLFEIAQMDVIANQIANGFPTGLANVPFLDNIPNYFMAGTFDALDILSIALGMLLAYLIIQYVIQKGSVDTYENATNN